ncbi:MAG: cysteine--tRNA ligase [Nanoarchaeota archaeon]
MQLQIYNTLTRKKEVFKPLKGNKINLFCCGPTTYGFIHIGNACTYTRFDFIVKYLRYRKFNVFYLMNITDIDDKIIKKAKEENTDWKSVTKKYEKAFYEDIKILGIDSADKFANATDYIPEIVSQVKRLVSNYYGYKISDGYYFDASKFKEYGKLAKRTYTEADDGVSRIDENPEKRNKADFCLWKFKKGNDPFWETELGAGRPGWHIEDTAITEKFFGPQYDIHGGGSDLIFPHHEAEIAQMESISGKPLVRYWMHAGMINMNERKMSKSLGNIVSARDLLSKYGSKLIRYLFLSNHYRSQLGFSEEIMNDIKNSLQRIQEFILKLKKGKDTKESDKLLKKAKEKFIQELDDDLNTPQALAVLFNLIRDLNKIKSGGKRVLKFFEEINEFFGFLEFKEEKIPEEIKDLVQKREKARKENNFKEADKLRNLIKEKGYLIEDTSGKTIVKRL